MKVKKVSVAATRKIIEKEEHEGVMDRKRKEGECERYKVII